MTSWLSILFLLCCHVFGTSSKPKLTFDEFFNYTDYTSLTLSPDDGQSILIRTRHRIWDENRNEHHLDLYSLNDKSRKLITRQASGSFKPQWKDEWIAFVLDNSFDQTRKEQYIHLYSTRTETTTPLLLGKESLHAFTWSSASRTLYFATRTSWNNESEMIYDNEWKDVIQYREQERGDTIYRLNIENITEPIIDIVTNISLKVAELICSSDGKYLIVSTESRSTKIESINDYEIYSFDLSKGSISSPIQLTHNQAIERNLKMFNDEMIFFTVTGEGSIDGNYRDSQGRLYSLNLTNHHIDRWANQFEGEITDFAFHENGRDGLILLGQLKTEVQIYTQQTLRSPLIKQSGWNGTYESIVTAFDGNRSTIAFMHSSFEVPQEIYFVHQLEQLTNAQSITNENDLFRERNIPKGVSYRWINKDDGTEIEGILRYPPEKFEQKNLPLLVLMHGGPYRADLNVFRASWYFCSVMMATENWLVFQPNYRGSTGYGDEFLNGVLLKMVSRPGRDVLFGVDALIRDGIADRTKLNIGGYSYGGYLTNWLITQTTRFNAALSGAGGVEHVIDWGTNDMPISDFYSLGGYPWQAAERYQEEAALLHVNKVRTPTHLVTGGMDLRVPVAQSYLFERSLHVLNVSHKLLVFPGEGHGIQNNPWHEKIKLREEIRWLNKYGSICLPPCDGFLVSSAHWDHPFISGFVISIFVRLFYLLNI